MTRKIDEDRRPSDRIRRPRLDRRRMQTEPLGWRGSRVRVGEEVLWIMTLLRYARARARVLSLLDRLRLRLSLLPHAPLLRRRRTRSHASRVLVNSCSNSGRRRRRRRTATRWRHDALITQISRQGERPRGGRQAGRQAGQGEEHNADRES